jgi:predicted kinase
MERVDRCQTQIWAMTSQIAARNVACVLDLGFSQTQSRAKFAGRAQAAGLSVQLHFIDVPAEERRRRVETRNARKGETYQLGFDVTREMFDFVEGLWEPPTHEEMLAYNGVRTSGI